MFKCSNYREEHVDLFQSVRVVSNTLEKHYAADALNIAIQDGKDAGQSVPHVHVHILPRKSGLFVAHNLLSSLYFVYFHLSAYFMLTLLIISRRLPEERRCV